MSITQKWRWWAAGVRAVQVMDVMLAGVILYNAFAVPYKWVH